MTKPTAAALARKASFLTELSAVGDLSIRHNNRGALTYWVVRKYSDEVLLQTADLDEAEQFVQDLFDTENPSAPVKGTHSPSVAPQQRWTITVTDA